MSRFSELFQSIKDGLNDLSDLVELFEQNGGFEAFVRENVLPELEQNRGQTKTIAQYYANLEIENGADMVEVKKAYRKLMHKYHPDKHTDDPHREELATQICKELTIAYSQIEQYHQRKQKR